MKKLLALVAVLLVAVIMIETVPDKEAHKQAMINAVAGYVEEEVDERGFGDNILGKISKGVINKTVEAALNMKLRVNNYYLWNTTHVRLQGKDQLLSVGLLGHVFTFDKKMLREKLEEAMKVKEEQASEKQQARQSARELRQLKREQKKRERQLRREQRKREREARREEKRREREAAKQAE